MEELLKRYPLLESCRENISRALDMMIDTYKNGGKILICGNGGSAADCEHFVGEMMKGFLLSRKVIDERIPAELREKLQGALPAISLPSQCAILSAFSNDIDPEMMYAQLVYGYATEKDLVIGLSTSGNSKNVLNALQVAKAVGTKTIAMTGRGGGKMAAIADEIIAVDEKETYIVQEYHLPIYHFLCAEVEKYFWAE